MSSIKFGTDGWRGVIAKDFTFENIRKVAFATAGYYKTHPKIKSGIVIGYDARFLSKEFAEEVALVLGNSGIKVFLADSIISTPMVATAILEFKAAGGVMITASHNPPVYNGFKLKSDYGGPARNEEITGVEKLLSFTEDKFDSLNRGINVKMDALIKEKMVNVVDLKKIYFNDIEKKLNFEEISHGKLKILFDPMFGSGQGLLDELFPGIKKIHNEYNPSFKSTNPEPLAQNCRDSIEKIIVEKLDLGIVTDGDADRIGTIDECGNFISTQLLFPIFLKYLVEKKGKSGKVVKTVSVSNIVERMCKKYNLECYETPVGFKYITEYMIDQDILIGGEESGGIGLNMHLPERDGIFNGLLLSNILIERRKPLSALVEEIYSEFGKTYYDRIDFHTTPEIKDRILNRCKKGIDSIAGYKVIETKRIDGYKYIFDDSWLLIRSSGTEPLLRFYSESEVEDKVQNLLDAAVKLK